MMKTVKVNEAELGERLRVLLERSSYIVNEEIYVRTYSRMSVDNGKDGRGRIRTSEYYQIEKNFTDIVADILRRTGISSNYKGFRYLIECCNLINFGFYGDYMITKDLYPEIARNFNTSAKCVERAIRTSIAAGWERKSMLSDLDAEIWNHFKIRPSNGAFIDILYRIASNREKRFR